MIARAPRTARRIAAVAVAAIAGLSGCAPPASYLGATLPQPCAAHDVEGCLGWMVERDLSEAELGLYGDTALRDYVQGIADRLATGSLLPHAPRIVITDHDGTYATSGSRIVIARPTIQRLDSEAELAGVIAHELAHIEGHHAVVSLFGPPPDADPLLLRRDAEAIADERAVALLERAGYSPSAMARALRAVLDSEDEEHPLRADRIAHVAVLAGHRTGFEGRAELLAHLDHMVAGHDSRLGHRVGDTWVIAALGVALDLEAGDVIRGTHDVLVVRRGRATLAFYPIGAPWAREIAASLTDRASETRRLGRITIGTMPGPDTPHPAGGAAGNGAGDAAGDGAGDGAGDAAGGPAGDAIGDADAATPVGKLARAVRSTLPQPLAGTRVALLERPHGALVIELSGRTLPELALRDATADELAAAEPARIVIEHAIRAGAAADALICEGRLLDDPRRRVAAGEPLKCADRALDAHELALDFIATAAP
ncbi:MAG TPA: M48 family metallopeptidase [Kofleriaceae bacterium]|jgi:hypothetical protein|nr:M48 family metallopeptidase [Kofleriaceae bacterium]